MKSPHPKIKKQTWFLYILRCADKTLYVGITCDLKKRIELHNSGKGAKYTRGRSPVKILYQEKCKSRSAASKREWEIKSWPRSKKILFVKSAVK